MNALLQEATLLSRGTSSRCTGPPDAQALETAMARAQDQARVCLSDAADAQAMGGEIALRVNVAPDGSFVQPEVIATNIADPSIVTCALDAVLRQRIARPGGGGFAPIRRTLVLWDPPESAGPVKLQVARRVLTGVLPELGQCLRSLPNPLSELDVDFLVGDRRLHPLTGAMPAAHARCVSDALASASMSGVGTVSANLVWDEVEGWTIPFIASTSAQQSEERTISSG